MKNFSKLGQFKSRGRLFKEANNRFRTPFQRDRDRIIHSASFRRLKHKTQVFVNTEGDHYRTRITHSIEVAQIARTIARFLKLNEELAETLSLAHDLGHTPFGHAGEEALDECMEMHGGFDHNLQTLRIVMFIENKYLKFKGLNLTIETIDGLIKHNGPLFDLEKVDRLIGVKNFKNKIKFNTYPSLEAQLSAISDDIAYNNHDIQDGIKAKLFSVDDLLEINFFKQIHHPYKKIKNISNEILIYQLIRESINQMVKDLIENSIKNIKKNKLKSLKNILSHNEATINFSSNFQDILDQIIDFLRIKMYNNSSVLLKNNNGKKIIKNLFTIINKKPQKYLNKIQLKFDKDRAIADYISGMTDRYAINLYKKNR